MQDNARTRSTILWGVSLSVSFLTHDHYFLTTKIGVHLGVDISTQLDSPQPLVLSGIGCQDYRFMCLFSSPSFALFAACLPVCWMSTLPATLLCPLFLLSVIALYPLNSTWTFFLFTFARPCRYSSFFLLCRSRRSILRFCPFWWVGIPPDIRISLFVS